MTDHLLAISIGPVQGFIAAARRTRDFWMGSTLLSEIAKAVAKHLHDEHQAKLIFPAPPERTDAGPDPLDPWDFAESASQAGTNNGGGADPRDFNVTNIIVCELQTDDPAAVAQDVRSRAESRWKEVVDALLGKLPRGARDGDLDTGELERQQGLVGDVVEVYTSWVPCNGGTDNGETDNYAEARRRVMRLLGARKACRDFPVWDGTPGKPKSSLDGARESVLKDERRGLLRVRDGEQLDLVGLVKRIEFGNDAIRYPSVSRFAADPWIRGVGRERLASLIKSCETLCESEYAVLRKRGENRRGIESDLKKFPWLEEFPFEGAPLYVDRHAALLREAPAAEKDDSRIRGELDAIRKQLSLLQRDYGSPSPYFAILAADGDGMGETISAITHRAADPRDAHRKFSESQSEFARRVRMIVNGQPAREPWQTADAKFHGATIYAGADDVLAFVPLDQCLDCARALHDEFDRCVAAELDPAVVKKLRSGRPTLSVGIAVGHFMDPLEDLLAFARTAEELAKARGTRLAKDGLAIAIHSRGGAPFSVRDRFDLLHGRLHEWIELHLSDSLPAKAAYDLRRAAVDFGNWTIDGKATPEEQLRQRKERAKAIQSEALRILARKRVGGGRAETGSLQGLLDEIQNADDLRHVAGELLVGQWLANSRRQAEGRGRTITTGEDS